MPLGSKRTRGVLDLRGVRDLAINDTTLETEDEEDGNVTAGGDTEIDKGASESGIAAIPRKYWSTIPGEAYSNNCGRARSPASQER